MRSPDNRISYLRVLAKKSFLEAELDLKQSSKGLDLDEF